MSHVRFRALRWPRALALRWSMLALLPTAGTLSGHAFAQQAADVATARKLAGEGIKLYENGDYAGALERLERAETLYSAPTHQLFIARAQAKVGRLVESAETYRKLARVVLDAAAPRAFRDAVDSAPKELQTLEPTIPLLTIKVEPAAIQGLALSIDGEAVSSAVLGAERPVNPGKHTISVNAPGYTPKSVDVELAPSGREEAILMLESSGSVEGAPAPAVKHGARREPERAETEPSPDDASKPVIGFSVGLRLSGALTGGDVDANRTMADYYGPGGGASIQAAVRFPSLLKSLDLGVGLFAGGYALRPGSKLDDLGSRLGTVTNAVNAEEAGFVLSASGKRHTVAPFGEIGLAVLHRIREARDFDLNDAASCQEVQIWSGPALAFTGGVHFPLGNWLTLSPHVGGSFGQFSHRSFTLSSGCVDGEDSDDAVDSGSRRSHVILGLGVGGEVWIGRD